MCLIFRAGNVCYWNSASGSCFSVRLERAHKSNHGNQGPIPECSVCGTVAPVRRRTSSDTVPLLILVRRIKTNQQPTEVDWSRLSWMEVHGSTSTGKYVLPAEYKVTARRKYKNGCKDHLNWSTNCITMSRNKLTLAAILDFQMVSRAGLTNTLKKITTEPLVSQFAWR